MAEIVYPPVIRFAKVAFRVLGLRIDVEDSENVPVSGGAVLACTHVSYLDFIFVGLGAYPTRRLVRFMAKKPVFDNKVSGTLMWGMHHIPVDRRAGAGAYDAALDALKAGELVGMFPEVTISRSFEVKDLKTGAVRLARDAGVPLLPVTVWGTQRLWTKGRPRHFAGSSYDAGCPSPCRQGCPSRCHRQRTPRRSLLGWPAACGPCLPGRRASTREQTGRRVRRAPLAVARRPRRIGPVQ